LTPAFNRLHLATRIHFTLLRELGEGVDVGRMLRQRDYADEVLNVCRGLEDFALVELADRFDDATAAESARKHMAQAAQRARLALAQIPRRSAGAAAQTMDWSAQTSGFGVTRALSDLTPTLHESVPAIRWPDAAPRNGR
jgi:hypothetical protein